MADDELSDLELAKKLAEEWEKEDAAQQQQQQQPAGSGKAEMDDAELARKLAEEWASQAADDSDMLLAKQLQQEEEEKEKQQKEAMAKLAAEEKKKQQLAAMAPPIPASDPMMAEFLKTPAGPLTKTAKKRIFQDLKFIIQGNDPTIHVHFEDDISQVEALVIGPSETPYEGGFFHFSLRFPDNYPWASPKVILRTTDFNRTRFNPNLYANGKVCLSILGTWSGPAWSPVQSISSVLLSIQSLMNKHPYHNEPGYEADKARGRERDRDDYNDIIRHENIRVAVLGMMENPTWGDCETFNDIRNKIFAKFIPVYEKIIQENMHLDGKPMRDPFGDRGRGSFQYKNLAERLEGLKAKFGGGSESSSSSNP